MHSYLNIFTETNSSYFQDGHSPLEQEDDAGDRLDTDFPLSKRRKTTQTANSLPINCQESINALREVDHDERENLTLATHCQSNDESPGRLVEKEAPSAVMQSKLLTILEQKLEPIDLEDLHMNR